MYGIPSLCMCIFMKLASKFKFLIIMYIVFQPSVRKTHCSGRKHKENVRLYYQKWLEEQVQKLVDDTSKSYKLKIALFPCPIPF